MTQHPKLATIVIPTYNRSGLLNMTLTSIRNQHIDKSLIEVIVVDDGSADDTFQVAESFKNDFSMQYFFQEDRGYRVGTARNTGIQHANGEIIIFVDSGMIAGVDFVQEHLASHQKHPDTAVLGYMFGFQERPEDTGFLIQTIRDTNPEITMDTLLHERRCLDIREKVFKICDSAIDQLPAPWVLFWTGNASASKQNILKAGLFDNRFDLRWGIEDIDLGYRLFRENIQFRLNRNARAIHYPHESDTVRKLEEEAINKLHFHEKHQSFETNLLLTSDPVMLNLALTTYINH
jgi:glycosyltransferase involved in cell wall biosynthesis